MSNEINAGSMADIAFLLLIFFLVTTVIAEDKGVLVKLPPWSEEPPENMKLNTRNVYSVLVNAQNQLLVRGQAMEIKELKSHTIEFITNPQKREDLSEAPTKALVSLKNDRGTNYATYLEAVSYTHLDVYKRQQQYCGGWPIIFALISSTCSIITRPLI